MPYLAVKDYEGLYEVNRSGEVRSVDRTVLGKDGAKYFKKGRVLRPTQNKQVGYLQVSLWKGNTGVSHYVHRLVAQAHIPNPKGLLEVNHIDGDRHNNCVTNLEWLSRQGNAQHAVDTGLRTYTHRLTREEFIECLWSVLSGESYTDLSLRVPYKVPFLSVKLRKLARELGVEGELNESIRTNQARRARVNGSCNK